MSGVSAAATVTMGIVALPAMIKRGYNKELVMGCIMAGGGLNLITSMDVDVSPLSQVQPVGLLVGGAFHSADGVAAGGLSDATAAGLNIMGQPLTSNQGPALDGLTLVAGVYDIGAGRTARHVDAVMVQYRSPVSIAAS